MAIGISPLVDFAFKLMLGNPNHTGITIHFLNAILAGQPRITQVKFLNPILNKDDIRRLFPDQEFSEAAGVLEMISQTPEQLMAYNARLKFQRDEAARMMQARLEGLNEGEQIGEARGIEIGEARGLQIGRINVLRELLCLPAWTAAEFSNCDAAQLGTVADQLQQQLRGRNS
jgi:hypothetical protein